MTTSGHNGDHDDPLGAVDMTGSRRGTAHLAAALLLLMAAVVVAYAAAAPVERAAAHESAAPGRLASTVAVAPESPPSSVPSTPPSTAAAAPAPPSTAPPTTPPATATAPPVPTTGAPAPAPATSAPPPPAPPSTVPAPAGSPARSPVRLLGVVGDSLAFSAAGLIDPALRAATFTPVLDVMPGRRIRVPDPKLGASAGRDAAAALAAFHPALWVIQLGTNDVFYEQANRDRYFALISSMLDAVGPDSAVVWINIWRADQARASLLFDDVLQQTAAVDRHLHVADWATVARTEPVLRPDGVHLSERGVQRFTETIVNAASLAVLAG